MPCPPGSQSPPENGRRRPAGQRQRCTSPQDCPRGSDECNSNSVVSTSFSSQDWSVWEEKASPAVEKASQFEAMERPPEPLIPDTALNQATPGGVHTGEGSHLWHPLRHPLPMPQEREASAAVLTSRWDHPLGFTATHITDVRDGLLRPEGGNGVSTQSHHCDSQSSSGIDRAQDKFLHVVSEAPRGAESHNPDINTLPTGEDAPQHVPEPCGVTPYADDLIPTSEKSISHLDKLSGGTAPQVKPSCGVLGQIPRRAQSEMGNLPPNADSSTVSSKSVTIQMSSNLALAAQKAVASGTDSRRTTLECTACDPVTTEPGLGTEARQVHDVSVQTSTCEPRFQPLTKSVSLDTGFPGVYPVDVCHAVHTHCCVCHHHHSHCQLERPSPGPVPSACRHCLCSHSHPEAKFTKTLQDTTVRDLCSVSIDVCEDGEADAAIANPCRMICGLPVSNGDSQNTPFHCKA